MPSESTYKVYGHYDMYRSYTDWNTGQTKFDPPEGYGSSAANLFEKSNLIVNAKQHDGYRTPSPYQGVTEIAAHKVDVTVPEYSEREGWGMAHYRYSGDMVVSFRPWWFYGVATAESDYKNPLRMKILNNIKDEILDVAMVLAEMQSTTTMLIDGLGRIARSLDAIKARKPESFHYLMHGRRKDGRRPTDKFLRETAGTYLEWKYGIMPTVYDVAGASKALDINEKGSLWDNPPLMVARAVIKDKFVVDGYMSAPYWSNPECLLELSVDAAARADYSVNAEGIRGLSRYGIGLGTVATIAFERTPFSFVLNMALPLAELIKAWTSLSAGVDVRGYSETFYVSYKVLAGQHSIHSGRGFLKWNDSTSRIISFKRNGGSDIPMPVPFLRNPLKTGNLATILALFTQLRRPSP